MKTKKEYLILEAYSNSWIGTFDNKKDAIREFNCLQNLNDGGDYYLYEAKSV